MRFRCFVLLLTWVFFFASPGTAQSTVIDKCVEFLIRRVVPGAVARRVASIARERYITAERAYALRVGGAELESRRRIWMAVVVVLVDGC